TFHELNVNAINIFCHTWDILDGHTAFIDDDWHGNVLAHEFKSFEIMRGEGLLDEFDVVRGKRVNHLDRLFRRPGSIGIDTDGCRRDIPNSFEVLKIVLGSDFDLED